MSSYDVNAWLQAIFRWLHVFAGILWIGQTYLFNFFEKNFEKSLNDENEVGKLWMVHGGGFYYVEKQNFRQQMPSPLHWFKWEAALTWISGVVLLTLVYYMGGILIEPEMDFTYAVGAGVGVIVAGWFVYDLLLRSPIGKNEMLFGALSFLILVGTHYFLSQSLSSRAAFFHIGALLGTIMVANVWQRILPAQRKILRMMEEGKEPDTSILAKGPQRSRHNSFMVIPLVFIMISTHYPTITYGNEYSTLVLGMVIVAGWGVARLFR